MALGLPHYSLGLNTVHFRTFVGVGFHGVNICSQYLYTVYVHFFVQEPRRHWDINGRYIIIYNLTVERGLCPILRCF